MRSGLSYQKLNGEYYTPLDAKCKRQLTQIAYRSLRRDIYYVLYCFMYSLYHRRDVRASKSTVVRAIIGRDWQLFMRIFPSLVIPILSHKHH